MEIGEWWNRKACRCTALTLDGCEDRQRVPGGCSRVDLNGVLTSAKFGSIEQHVPIERSQCSDLGRYRRLGRLSPFAAIDSEFDSLDSTILSPGMTGDVDHTSTRHIQQMILQSHIDRCRLP